MQTVRVSVRALVESVMISGDIMPAQGTRERLLEGLLGHQRIQREALGGVERPVRLAVRGEHVELLVTGRIDILEEGALPRVVEIKTTLRPPERIGQDDYPLHWAQAECYAHMLAEETGAQRVEVALMYVQADGEGSARFSRTLGADALSERFMALARVYLARQEQEYLYRERRDATIDALPFPFDSYRAGQRDAAGQVYVAMRDRKRVFLEAPTGTGKTMAALYPAVKALGAGHVRRIFYLTAKTTARAAARDALRRMGERGLHIRALTLTAKDKQCPCPDAFCGPESCPRALGHYDRLPDALEEALTYETHYDAAFIADCAERHMLCPFEFALDLSVYADVVICDYNYVFDPRVRLKRFADDRRCAVLVDEAHNLCDRARDMYSAFLSRDAFVQARRAVGAQSRKTTLYKSIAALCKVLKGMAGDALLNEPPEALTDAASRYLEAAESPAGTAVRHPALTRCYLDTLFYRYVLERYGERHRTVVETNGGDIAVTLLDRDPADELTQALHKRACVMFSATLSPPEYYIRVCGGMEDDPFIALPSPFPREHLLTLCRPIDTRYSRREATRPDVARALAALCLSRTGNYLCFFPSYRYMEDVLEVFTGLYDGRVIAQSRNMDDAGRDAFLAAFTENPKETLAGFAVLGGVFGEGVDLAGDRLSGVALVGVGMPQIGHYRDAIGDYFDDPPGRGFDYAYRYPGLNRVMQAGGRLIRSADDRGVLLLIDHRYLSPSYADLLPTHWFPMPITRDDGELIARIETFWERR